MSKRSSRQDSLLEISLVTSPPKPFGNTTATGTFKPSAGWWILVGMMGFVIVLLAVVAGLQVTDLIKSGQVTSSVNKLRNFFGVASVSSSDSSSMNDGGLSILQIVQASINYNPIPSYQYINLVGSDLRMAYRTRGNCADNKTDVIIFVHTLGGTSGEWIIQVNKFALTYCTIAIDLIGHGLSDAPPQITGGTITAHAGYLRGFMLATGLVDTSVERKLHVVANGFGGVVVVQYLASYPGDFDRIVIVSPIPVFINPIGMDLGGLVTQAIIYQIAQLSASNSTAFALALSTWMVQGDTCYNSVHASAIKKAIFDMAILATPVTLYDALISLSVLDHRGVFDDIAVPISFIVGANHYDMSFNAVRASEAARSLVGRGSPLYVIAGAGRIPHITHVQAFNHYVEFFLSSRDSVCDCIHPEWLR